MIILLPLFSLFGQQAGGETDLPESEDPVFIIEEGDAVEDGTVSEAEQPGNLVDIWEFVRMLLVLAGVVGVIYLFFFFLKKGMKKRLPETELIQILAAKGLQGSDMLYLVRLGNLVYLVGSGAGGISLISEISDKETLDTVRLQAAESTPVVKQSFSDILSRLFNPGKKQDTSMIDPIDFMKRQQERLNKLK
ncbi:MAG: flagellar biosynthetic protein FliO [Spirochaetales bacterium]|nr:flagellar biosynthetic protein FliO [Spirochaetales bacterium]